MDTVMEMTPEELYTQKKLGPILAQILNISSSNVKVVSIKEDNSNRKRRSINGQHHAELMFEVGSLAEMGELGARSGTLEKEERIGIDELLGIPCTF